MGRAARSTPLRCAYTLVEMLIVLAVLAVLTGLTWPSVRSMMGKGELRAGAKQVRSALARARLEAIESGVAQAVRYQPGAARFRASPLTMPGNESEKAPRSSGARRSRTSEPVEDRLPRGLWFADLKAAPSQNAQAPPASTGRTDDADWATPIVFFPSGRSTNARVRLVSSSGYQVEVALRGLTGTAQIGPLERIEDPLAGRVSHPSSGSGSGREPPPVGRVGNAPHTRRTADDSAAP